MTTSRRPRSAPPSDNAAGAPVGQFTRRQAMQLHILHHAGEGEIRGAWMAEELRRHSYDVSTGTLCPRLHRMQDHGLLTSRRVAGRRRTYLITDAGRDELAAERRAPADLAAEVLGHGQGPSS